MDVEISLVYSSAAFARGIMAGLTPDNKLSSTRMRISAGVSGRKLSVQVVNCKRIETMQATIQDIFRCIRAAESSLSTAVSQKKP